MTWLILSVIKGLRYAWSWMWVVAESLRLAVFASVYLEMNAEIQLKSHMPVTTLPSLVRAR